MSGHLGTHSPPCDGASQTTLPAGIFLMGYGLVAIPRLLWQSADIRGQQRILYARAGQQAEAAMTAHRYILLSSDHASCMHGD